jgi:two-component system NtrC family sensor kinase
MNLPNFQTRVRFQAKVLIPVVCVMILLTGVTVWLVNQRIGEQLDAQASERLYTAKKHFQTSQEVRENNLLMQYRNLGEETKYKSLFLNLCTEDAFQRNVNNIMQAPTNTLSEAEAEAEVQKGIEATATDFLTNLLSQRHVQAAAFAFPDDRHPLFAFASEGGQMDGSEFKNKNMLSIQKVYASGGAVVDMIGVGSQLLDIVSIPLNVHGETIGVMTFGFEIGSAEAMKLKQMTGSEVVLLSGGRVAASSLPDPRSKPELAGQIRAFSEAGDAATANQPRKIMLAGQHYICVEGRFTSLNPEADFGYILVSSYQSAWVEWQETQRVLLLVGLFGTLAGAGVIFLLVRQVTRPLRQLRDSAEAVGRGDYAQRVEVNSSDECGELATVFNQMTENIQASRCELEKTVETLKTTQNQLIQSEKLSGIGEFVAGVAHELNNPLTSVMGFAELLQQSDLPEQQRRYLDVIFKSAKRCQKIVQSLLSFARRHAPERKVICVNEIVESAVEILQYQMRTSNIEVVTQLDPNLPLTEVDSHQMQQVFLNLINNARQAMEGQAKKGRLRVKTESDGVRVRIIFEDNGPGIPEENLKKIFNPFFTTKEVGKGTGLGLSLCYGIVSEHGGTITPHSKQGEGAMFVIEIPVVNKPATAPEKKPAADPEKATQEGVGKRVLVIDDEDAILQMIRAVLTMNGYKVDVALDGETALTRLKQYHYDLALCDWKMPGLNGQEVYERLSATDPAMSRRMIFITGDTVNEKTQEFLREREKVCLSKPFTLVDFRSAINRVMETAGEG